MKNRIKKFVRDNRVPFAYYTAGCIIGVVAYTKVCKSEGFQMVRPLHLNMETGTVYAQTITGKIVHTTLIDK